MKKGEDIYNNIIHSSIKVELVKTFYFSEEEDINNLISNV